MKQLNQDLQREILDILYIANRVLPDAEAEFQDYAERYGLRDALNWKAEMVRRAEGHDDYAGQVADMINHWGEDLDPEHVDPVDLKEIRSHAADERDRAFRDARKDWYANQPHSHMSAYREGRGRAIETLTEIIQRADVVLNA